MRSLMHVMWPLSCSNPIPHAIAVYAPTHVASGHVTLATKRTLLLTWASTGGIAPALIRFLEI